jgi:hypothetical protein
MRNKGVPNIAYFCAKVLSTGHCMGQNGESGISVRGLGCNGKALAHSARDRLFRGLSQEGHSLPKTTLGA